MVTALRGNTKKVFFQKFRSQDSRNRQNSIDDLTEDQQDMLESLTYQHIQDGT